MTRILWDQVGDHLYETGIDRGVLYLQDGSGVPWNGLTSVQENLGDDTSNPVFFDGAKLVDAPTVGNFSATINAFTYPDEFSLFEGFVELEDGFSVGNQGNPMFGLSYRTLIGNDVDGTDLGYKIHIVYNLSAVPAATSYKTLSGNVDPIEFGWTITSVPEHVPGYRATAHAVIDSRYMNSELLAVIEDTLYGTETTSAQLPSLTDLTFFSVLAVILIVDNGDGTWTATGPDEFITMLDSTTFQITGIDALYLDADTYQISTFNVIPTIIYIVDNGDGTWTATGPDEMVTMINDGTFQITGMSAIFLDAETYQFETT